MSMRVLFIVNPISGTLENRDELISEICNSLNHCQIKLWQTTGEKDEEGILEVLKTEDPELVIVGGGDGTIKLVVSQLGDREVPILPIPFGSANGLCRCLGIMSWEDSLAALKKGTVVNMDVLEVNGELCLHLADFGFNAGLIQRFEEDEQRGMAGYFKSSLAQAFEDNKFRFNLSVKGEWQTLPGKMLVIANGSSYGTGAKINPSGVLDDGKFEVIVLNPDSFQEWAQLTLAFFREDFENLPFVYSIQCEQAEIENPDGTAFHIDGETKLAPPKVEVRITDRKFSFFSNLPGSVSDQTL